MFTPAPRPARDRCLVTLLTPAGRGAVATLSVDGLEAESFVAKYFRPHGKMQRDTLPIGRVVVGRWHNPGGNTEETVVCRRAADHIEINCHGGLAASESIIQSLVLCGAIRTDAIAWLEACVGDPIQRAAWEALTHARTPRTAGILLDQFHGALASELQSVIDKLRDMGRGETRMSEVEQRLDRLLAAGNAGMHLVHPWRVVFAGPPNVGKSSLINAILGYERAIVFDEPGTTRDVLTASAALDGWPIELVDTAGLRDSRDPIEVEGVQRARAQLAAADLVVLVHDLNQTEAALDERLGEPPHLLMVLNKCDLEGLPRVPTHWICTSAKTGMGLSELLARIVKRLIPVVPQPGEPVPFTQEQLDGLRGIIEAIRQHQLDAARELAEGLIRHEGVG